MLKSMTGFGSKEGQIIPLGKVSVELKSSNHKFLDAVFHLPDGFLSLEESIKKEVESKIKRGRVTCVITIAAGVVPEVLVNKQLLKDYISQFKNIKQQFHLQDEVRLDTLMHLPGVLSLTQTLVSKAHIWSPLKSLVNQALEDLIQMRQKEGAALCVYLKNHTVSLKGTLKIIKIRFKKVIRIKLAQLKTDEERFSFLKDKDINEEIERLTFHIKNFKNRLSQNGPVGKELDFIAQEMQREANTIASKSCDAIISGSVVQIKSLIEKIREQVQNIE